MTLPSVFAETTNKTMDQAIEAVEAALKGREFAVLWHLDINEKLKEKDLEPAAPFHILEVCSAPRARRALTTNQRAGYFLPCKIVVYQDEKAGKTVIGLQKPRLMADLVGDPQLEPLADEVEALLKAAIIEAAQD